MTRLNYAAIFNSKILKKVLTRLVIYCLVIFFWVRFLEFRNLFHPIRKLEATPQDIGLRFEDILFPVGNQEQINGWFIKAPNAQGTIIVLHGNAGNISHRLEKIACLYSLGLNVFIFDYRGFGKSTGKPTESNVYADAISAYDYLVSRKDIDASRLIGYGESLGTAVAVKLATARRLKALVLESSFTCAKDVAKSKLPFLPTFLMSTKMDSLSDIRSLRMPKLFIHSFQDEIIEYQLGRKLFDAAPWPKTFLQIHGGHNDGFLISREEFIDGVRKFLYGLDETKSPAGLTTHP